MCKEPDVMKSYNPKKYLIDESKYKDKHIFDMGSTIVLSNLHNDIYPSTNEESCVKDILFDLSNCYGKMIEKKNIELLVNGKNITTPLSYFKEPSCQIFNRNMKLYIMEKIGENDFMYCEIDNELYCLSDKTNNLTKDSNNIKILLDKKKKVLSINIILQIKIIVYKVHLHLLYFMNILKI